MGRGRNGGSQVPRMSDVNYPQPAGSPDLASLESALATAVQASLRLPENARPSFVADHLRAQAHGLSLPPLARAPIPKPSTNELNKLSRVLSAAINRVKDGGAPNWPLAAVADEILNCAAEPAVLAQRYFSANDLLASVESSAIAPLSGRWVVALRNAGGRIERRQDLPPEAFISAAKLRRLVLALGDDFGLLVRCLVSMGRPLILALPCPCLQPANPEVRGSRPATVVCRPVLQMAHARALRSLALSSTCRGRCRPNLSPAQLRRGAWVDLTLSTHRGV